MSTISTFTRAFTLLALLTALAAAQPDRENAQLGLEIRFVPVSSTGTSIGLALRSYQNFPTGIDEETLTLLSDNGLRIVAVPIANLQDAMRTLTPIGTIQTETLGMLYRWQPIFTGPELEEDFTSLDTGPLRLPRGKFRLLARSWIVPDLTDANDTGTVKPRLRVELIPQHEQSRRTRFDQLLDPAPPTLEDRGFLFRRLHITTDIPEGYALIIVPASPSVRWDSLKKPVIDPTPSPDANPTNFGPKPTPDPDSKPQSAPRPEVKPTVTSPTRQAQPGPIAPTFRSLGEQLLRKPAGVFETPGSKNAQTIHRERSLVIILIPHVPSRYALIP
jgi:hypothetical protein